MFKLKKKKGIELMVKFLVSFLKVFLEMRINVKSSDLYHMSTVVQIF